MDFVRYSISSFLGAPGRNRQNFGAFLLRVCLVIVLFFTLNVQAAFSQDGSPQSPAAMPTWIPQIVEGPPYFVNMTSRALSFQAGSQPCAAYGGDGLYYTCYVSPTGWTPTTVIDDNIWVGEYASLSHRYIPFMGGTRTAITYYDAYNGRLKLAYQNSGGIWNVLTVPAPVPPYLPRQMPKPTAAPTFQEDLQHPWMNILRQADPNIVYAEVGVGKYNSLKLDVNGGFHISYYDEYDASLNFAYWDGGGDGTDPNDWVFELVDDTVDIGKGLGLWSSIQVDSYFNIHIAYMSEKYDHLKYAFRNHTNNEWTVVTADNGGAQGYNVGSMCSLALDGNNIPYISYLDFSLGNLKVAKLNNLRFNLWTIDKVDTADYTGWWSSIYVEPGGKTHISYYNASTGDLKYAVGKPGGTWTKSTLQKTPGNVGWFTSIAWNAALGKPAILYYESLTGRLLYIYQYSNTRWSTPQVVNQNSRDVGLSTSLALNSSGVPFISYFDTSYGVIKLARAIGTNWSIMYPYLGSPSGLFSSLKLGPDGNPRIAFYDQYHGNLLYGAWNGSSLGVQLVDWRNDVGQYPSLEIDSNGAPNISYYNATNKNLMYAYWDISSTHWFTYTLDDVGDVGKYTSIVRDSTNHHFISYYDETNGNLKLIFQNASYNWETPIIVDQGGALDEDVGWYTSIALDSLGNPHISYYDPTNGDLKYAFWEGSGAPAEGTGWNITTLRDIGDVGRFTSLKIYQPDDSRHLCYYDYTNGTLMYARYSAGIWEFQTVDNSSDVGLFCSIDLVDPTKIAISYYDNGRKDLKIALSYALPPANDIYLPVITK